MPASPLSGAVEFAKMVSSGGLRLDPLASSPSIEDIRRLARRRLPRMAFDILDGATGQEQTREENIADLREVRFRPRWLTDISTVDASTSFCDLDLERPYVMGPLGLQRMIGGEGEKSAVRAAGAANIPFTISTASNWSMEELAAEATGPLWFQLYMYKSERIVSNLISRARDIGAEVLMVTVDVPLNGKRYRDHRNGMSIPPRITPRNAVEALRHLGWTRSVMRPPAIGFRNLIGEIQGDNAVSHQDFVNRYLANLTLTWDSIEQVRRQWDGPLFLKGITTPEDALRSLAVGADGIYVSNHGGRQLDSVPSAIRTLPTIADAVGDRLQIVFDSGIRSGADIAKALAMGADLVSIGRAWGYGNAAAGEAGVRRVLEILDEELALTMGLLGATDVGALDRSFVEYPEAWHGRGLHREPEPDTTTSADEPTGVER
ncbi:MAG: alpha-hydroxy acid oxidase [Brachybacterium sp.]|nr:alpha-hydroxy acid oxidase [Brachybacterium sp.]